MPTLTTHPSRVFRHESEQDRWEMVQGAPDPRLRGHVRSYCSYSEETTTFVRRRELPSVRAVLIINLGEPIRVLARGLDDGWSDQPEGFVAGLHTGTRHNKVYGAGSLLLNLAYATAAD